MALPMLQVKMFRLCTISNQFRNVLSIKYPVSLLQPSCGVKQSLQQKYDLPEKPKRPTSAFFRFLVQIRPTIIKENPDLKFTEVGKIAAQKWEKVDPNLKNQLETEYIQELKEYRVKKLNYNTNLTSQQKLDLNKAKQEAVESKEKKLRKKKIKELGRPKKPLTSFFRYMSDRLSERGATPMKEWQQKMSKEWEELNEAKKMQYYEEAKRGLAKYQEDLLQWEEKMIKLGHLDVVRTEALLPKSNLKK